MSEFSLQLLSKKFFELDISQESVETISLWMIHHRRHAATIVKYWSERFNITTEVRKLALLFVVNDILKSNKTKSKIYHKEFERVLPDALIRIAKSCTSKQLLHQTRRMLSIWETQKYFKKEVFEKFWFCLGDEYNDNNNNDEEKFFPIIRNETENEKENINTANELENDNIEPMALKQIFLATEAPEPEELIAALESLENLPSADKAIRTKISNITLKELDDFEDRQEAEKYCEKLDGAIEMVDDYNKRLELEIVQRKKLDKMLNAFKESEALRVSDIEQKIQETMEELKRISLIREDIKEHSDSFPDLHKYNSNQELPPLPRVEDLFKRH